MTIQNRHAQLSPGDSTWRDLFPHPRCRAKGTDLRGGQVRALLRASIVSCRRFHPFDLEAIVLLHDHLHLLIALPDGDADFSRRVSGMKSGFTRSFLAAGEAEQPRSRSRLRQRARGVWQRRFWEHMIHDETDRVRHLDYIHYNAVKHGYVMCPHAWPHSSFHRLVREEWYERNWCCRCEGRVLSEVRHDDIAKSAGE